MMLTCLTRRPVAAAALWPLVLGLFLSLYVRPHFWTSKHKWRQCLLSWIKLDTELLLSVQHMHGLTPCKRVTLMGFFGRGSTGTVSKVFSCGNWVAAEFKNKVGGPMYL